MAKAFLPRAGCGTVLYDQLGMMKFGGTTSVSGISRVMRSHQTADSGMSSYDAGNLRDYPNHVDMLIIGGGLSGLSIAYFLSVAGNARVLLLERGRLGEEIMFHKSGFLAANHLWQNYALPEIVASSLDIYNNLFGDRKATDLQPWSRLLLAFTEASVMQLRRVLPLVKACGMEAKMLTSDEVGYRYQGYEFADLKAALLVNDFKVNQFAAVQSFAKAASRAGVSILENCPVKSFKILNDHSIEGVETNFGLVKCDVLVDTAGAVIP
ncbi:hypothetical protein D918_04773 [Trichuris suis]|nr:hypothetical protein D918_04773 [Trichuris suis]